MISAHREHLRRTAVRIEQLINEEEDEAAAYTNAAGLYAKFRGSALFLVALAMTIGFWITWNVFPGLPHFDGPDFGRLNLVLSTEASLSVALLIMANDKQDVQQRKQLRYMLTTLEAMRAMLTKLAHEIQPPGQADG